MSAHVRLAGLCLALSAMAFSTAACLDPLVSDDIDPSRVFGDPNVDLNDLPHVEDQDELAQQVETYFPESVAYLKGYADGQSIWYWNVPGPNSDIIAPLYVLINANGDIIEFPIFDSLPGDTGYTPWWRLVLVQITDDYDGERIWSREAVDLGVQLGILHPPVETDEIINCPVVRRGIQIEVGNGKTVPTELAWYRNLSVDVVSFKDHFRVPTDVQRMPSKPIYVLQRINEAFPLYEYAIDVDLNGDGRLTASNNIFAGGFIAGEPDPVPPSSERYSPLWYIAEARIAADIPSIDTSTGAVLKAETDLYADPERTALADGVVSITKRPDQIVNCPIQRVPESL